MSYGKKRLRRMSAEQRLQAKLANELQSVLTRWKNSIERMAEIELDASLGVRTLVNGHGLQGPNVRVVAGKVEDYWPTLLCANCQTPTRLSEGEQVHAASEQADD
jgi:hypothetical protein